MKVGVIVHSKTGNTLSVAKRIQDKLIAAGHSVNLEQVVAVNEDPSAAGNIKLKTIPDTSIYDMLIFGAPVHGFSLSPVMKLYLSQLQTLKGKKVGCFITQSFPFPWMGGSRSIRQMITICKDKSGNVYEAGIVNWSNKERERKIADILEKVIDPGVKNT